MARIHGPIEALGERLTAVGGELEVQGAHVLLDLGESLSTSDLLALCVEADVTVVEMLPLARALS